MHMWFDAQLDQKIICDGIQRDSLMVSIKEPFLAKNYTTSCHTSKICIVLLVMSVPKIIIPSTVVIHYCAWYTYFWNGRYIHAKIT